jgi:hypothetical protein
MAVEMEQTFQAYEQASGLQRSDDGIETVAHDLIADVLIEAQTAGCSVGYVLGKACAFALRERSGDEEAFDRPVPVCTLEEVAGEFREALFRLSAF